MRTNRRDFLTRAGAAGAGVIALADRARPQAAAAAPAADAKAASSVTELFLDNNWLEVTPSVSRRLHPPRKHPLNPVVRQERWYEGNLIQPYTTMYDEDDRLFKMWARSGSEWQSARLGEHAAVVAYYVSTDGVHWQRPELGVTEVAGRRDHNIVFTGDMVSPAPPRRGRPGYVETGPPTPQGKKALLWSVARHPRPRSAGERFVGLAIVQDHRRGAHLATSPDGVRWSCAEAPFWQTPNDVSGKGDDYLMHLMFDHAWQSWRLYRRIVPEFSERMIANHSDLHRPGVDRYYRAYAYAESGDLRRWTNHRLLLSMDADDLPDTELYQFACHKIGATYVGYMSVLHLREPQTIDVHLVTSRDGLTFTRVRRGEPFIAAGPPGSYDCMAMGCSQPAPLVVNDTVYYYYAACNFHHNLSTAATSPAEFSCGAALATFKRDRYASLETGEDSDGASRVVTRPMSVDHPRLFVNAATWMDGEIVAEALTSDWRPIAGFTRAEAAPIRGDALDHPVRWKDHGDLSRLLGSEVRFKFYMRRARIYAMTLARQGRPLGEIEAADRHEPRAAAAPGA